MNRFITIKFNPAGIKIVEFSVNYYGVVTVKATIPWMKCKDYIEHDYLEYGKLPDEELRIPNV